MGWQHLDEKTKKSCTVRWGMQTSPGDVSLLGRRHLASFREPSRSRASRWLARVGHARIPGSFRQRSDRRFAELAASLYFLSSQEDTGRSAVLCFSDGCSSVWAMEKKAEAPISDSRISCIPGIINRFQEGFSICFNSMVEGMDNFRQFSIHSGGFWQKRWYETNHFCQTVSNHFLSDLIHRQWVPNYI